MILMTIWKIEDIEWRLKFWRNKMEWWNWKSKFYHIAQNNTGSNVIKDTGKQENMTTRKHEDKKTRKQEDKKTKSQENKKARRQENFSIENCENLTLVADWCWMRWSVRGVTWRKETDRWCPDVVTPAPRAAYHHPIIRCDTNRRGWCDTRAPHH